MGHSVTMFNAQGIKVLETQLNAQNTQLNIASLSAGVFAVILRDASGNIRWANNYVKLGY